MRHQRLMIVVKCIGWKNTTCGCEALSGVDLRLRLNMVKAVGELRRRWLVKMLG